ncbi:MAG: hypothetical protein C4320_06240, partial [Armatimonadota bacterium]
MRIADWAQRLGPDFDALEALLPESGTHAWFSIANEARAFILGAQYLRAPRKMLVIVPTYERALQWQARLELTGVPRDRIGQLPSGSSSLFEDGAHEQIAQADRLAALGMLVDDQPNIVLATPQAALERTLDRATLLDTLLEVKVGDTVEFDELTRRFVTLGYERQEPVRIPGQFSVRGGILDVFPTGYDRPLRIELFGDDVESIRSFDPNTQRSTGTIPALRLTPSRETLYLHLDESLPGTLLEYAEREATLLEPENGRRLLEHVGEDADRLGQRVYFDRLDLYRPYLHQGAHGAADLLPSGGLLVLEEPLELEAIGHRAEEELNQALRNRAARGEMLGASANDFAQTIESLGVRDLLALSSMNALPDWVKPQTTVEIGASSLEPYRGRPDAFAETLRTWLSAGLTLVFGTDQPNRARTVLAGLDVHPATDPDEAPTEKGVAYLASGNLAGGFSLPDCKIVVVTDAELFGVGRLRLPQKRFNEGTPVATVLDLKSGDYVVHINFGIGVFRGLVNKEVAGAQREFLALD